MWCKFGRVPNLEGTKPSLARTSCFGGLAIRKAVNVTKCIVPEILVEIYFLENPKAGSQKGSTITAKALRSYSTMYVT